MTLDELIAKHGLTMRATPAANNPLMESRVDHIDMDHWRCAIRNANGTRIVVAFSMGIGHRGRAPELREILDCLASDASGVESAGDLGFERWAYDYGYDTDSRKAERIYKACRRICDKLKRLMGADYATLIFDTERL